MSAPNGATSMTGYGRASAQTAVGSVTVELRSTNHRYLELDQRVPAGFSSLQERIAEEIRKSIRRGRVDVFIAVHAERRALRKVQLDEELLQGYHDALQRLKGRFGVKGPVTLEHLLSLPQAVAVTEERVPAEQLWQQTRAAVQEAVRELLRARRREGSKLAVDLRKQLKDITQHAHAIKRRLPKALAQQRQRLSQRLRELLGRGAVASVSQLEQAAALVREADVHEELVRLDSHLTHMRQALSGHQLLGKRMDFIAQELMRETNTLGSKVNDPDAVRHVVEIKGCIEKIREQVQNLE